MPRLSNNFEFANSRGNSFEDPISFETERVNRGWYIVPNLKKGPNSRTTNRNNNKNPNKEIRQLYKKNTLNQILLTSSRSPFTRVPITRRDIRQYQEFYNAINNTPLTLTAKQISQRRAELARHFKDLIVIRRRVDKMRTREWRTQMALIRYGRLGSNAYRDSEARESVLLNKVEEVDMIQNGLERSARELNRAIQIQNRKRK